MGTKADDILQSFWLSTDVEKKNMKLCKQIQSLLLKQRNPISRKPDDGEPVNYTFAKHCKYGELYDQMIHDQTVVGNKDTKLWKKMQMDANLNLEKEITMS